MYRQNPESSRSSKQLTLSVNVATLGNQTLTKKSTKGAATIHFHKKSSAIKWQVLGNFPVCFSDSLVLFLGLLGVLAALAASAALAACSASGPGAAGGAFSERTSAAAAVERRSLASVSCSKAAILGAKMGRDDFLSQRFLKVWMFYWIF